MTRQGQGRAGAGEGRGGQGRDATQAQDLQPGGR